MKRFLRIAILVLTIAAASLVAAACGKKISSVELTAAPRATYLVGQELDLTQGTLTVYRGEESEEIALNDPDVTVSGYDKDTVGRQTLTVTYKGKTAEYTVDVVNRMTPSSDLSTKYFVGEPIDRAHGSIVITENDGTSFTVPFSDETLTVGEVENTTPGAKTVEITYHEDEKSYTDTVTLTYFTADEDHFTRPRKTIYASHDEGLSVLGGYIDLKGDGGRLTRYVELTADMVSGFDLEEATLENARTEPYTQKLTVSYASFTYQYSISISYSDVSLIRLRAGELSSLDFTQSIPEITADQGTKATEAMRLYLGLTQEDKALISDADLLAVARTAAAYNFPLWEQEIAQFKDAFTPLNGRLYLLEGNRKAAQTAYESLTADGETPAVIALSGLLSDTVDEMQTKTVYGSTTFATYLRNVPSAAEFTELTGKLNYMFTLYESLAGVPDSWTAESLGTYAQQIGTANSYIANSPYSGFSERPIYGVVSSWRTNDDFFDILYTYYLAQEDNTSIIEKLASFQFPGTLEDFYDAVYYARVQISGMLQLAVYDNTDFMLYLAEATEYAAQIKEAGGLQLTLYQAFGFDNSLLQLRTGTGTVTYNGTETNMVVGGLYYQSGALLGSKVHEQLWADYLEIVRGATSDIEYLNSDEFGEKTEALFRAFVTSGPAEQFGFLMSLGTYYGYGIPEFTLGSVEDTEGMITYFMLFLMGHYGETLGADAMEVFYNLLTALECFARYPAFTGVNYAAEFARRMTAAETLYTLLPPESKQAFNAKLEWFYTLYIDLFHTLTDTESDGKIEIPTEWNARLSQLSNHYNNLMVEYQLLTDQELGLPDWIAIFSTWESVEEIVGEFYSDAPEEVLFIYQNLPIYQLAEDRYVSFDFAWYYFRSVYTNLLISLQLTNGPLWEVYKDSGIQHFLAEANELFITQLQNLLGQEEAVYSDRAAANALMALFRSLDAADRELVYTLDYLDLYMGGLLNYFTAVLDGDALTLATDLLQFEQYYTFYQNDPDGTIKAGDDAGTTYRAKLDTLMTEIKELRGKIIDVLAFNQYLKDFYEAYVAIYDSLGA